MKAFVELFEALDRTTKTNAKVAALVEYFRETEPADAAWAVYFLTGQRLKRLVGTRELREWTAEFAGLPLWLVEDSYQHVGDLAETMALLAPEPETALDELPSLGRLIETQIRPLAGMDDAARRIAVFGQWRRLPGTARFLYNKMITGALRVGVSKRLVTRALAELAGVDSGLTAHRLMGDWQPTAENYQRLLAGQGESAHDHATPYPFFLASPLEAEPATLGSADQWRAEWKWDGIRAQLIRRGGETILWSRGEERLDGRFPEIERAADALADGTVIDGEIMAWRDPRSEGGNDGGDDGGPLPFSTLQTRIGRRKPGAKTLAAAPTVLLAFDLLELEGRDMRATPLRERVCALGGVVQTAGAEIRASEAVGFRRWDALPELRSSSRERGVEGLMLKHVDSAYQVGRKRGDWWKWKVEPYTFDGVLLYAQPGHGRRSGLFTDYTFAVHSGNDLVPVAKAYSGLKQEEIDELDRWIRSNTRERFGPVRSVEPVHVFELAFEGIARSGRHKSGVALRFPRIHRWRRDLKVDDADRLEDLERLLAS